jgi:predicted ATPase
MQAEIGDVFIEGALSEQLGGRVFFVETHSEHLTLRLLRRIRESTRGQARFGITVKPTDVGVWYVDRSTGTVTVKQILVDVEGEFVQPWPEDDSLFEQDFRERYA